MKEKTFLKWVMTLVLVTLMFTNVYGDIYMKQKQHTEAFTMMGQTQPAKDLTNETWITSDKIVTMNEKQKTIIDMNMKSITMVDHEKKTIVNMPMDFSKNVEKHGDMSSEEKAQFEQFMGKMMQINVQVEETNERKKIGNWNCRKYLQTIKMSMGTTNSEIWATDEIEVDGNIYAKYTAGMMAQLPGMSQNMGAVTDELKKIKGVHVYSEQTVTMMGQPMKSTVELLEFKEEKAPSSVFDLPKGYKKEDVFR